MKRFVLSLETENAVEDVMNESRGGKENIRLKKSFKRIYEEGIEFVPVAKFKTDITSTQLKAKPKSNHITGLQITDLLHIPVINEYCIKGVKLIKLVSLVKK